MRTTVSRITEEEVTIDIVAIGFPINLMREYKAIDVNGSKYIIKAKDHGTCVALTKGELVFNKPVLIDKIN